MAITQIPTPCPALGAGFCLSGPPGSKWGRDGLPDELALSYSMPAAAAPLPLFPMVGKFPRIGAQSVNFASGNKLSKYQMAITFRSGQGVSTSSILQGSLLLRRAA